jgi:hypothetical protein
LELDEISEEKMANPFSDSGSPAPLTACAIKDQDLFGVFQEVLEKWAFSSCDSMGTTAEGPVNLPLERMVGFTGPWEGFLVVRAPEGFGRMLWENVAGEGAAPNSIAQVDAFSEFVNLYFGHLLTLFRQRTEGTFDPYLPQASNPSLWPGRRPDAALAILVDDMPVEVRLWLEKISTPALTTLGTNHA